MENAVVILGAGSSADFGVPTLNGIFNEDHVEEYLDAHPRFADALQEVFWEPRGHTRATADESINVEEMLTVLRDWEAADGVPDPPAEMQVPVFRKHLYALIERAVHRDRSTSDEHLNPLLDYCRAYFRRTTWASFNWDCMFEATYWWTSGYPPPGTRPRTNPRLAIPVERWRAPQSRDTTRAGHELLKLHGSVSWWLAPAEDGEDEYKIRSYQFGGEVQRKFDAYDADENPEEIPAILEPSFHKYNTDLYRLLEPQWDRLQLRLVEADIVIVVGYSLPPADSEARATLLNAFQVNRDAPWVVVDPGQLTRARYRRLFGQERLTIHPLELSEFNEHLEESLDETRLTEVEGEAEAGATLPF